MSEVRESRLPLIIPLIVTVALFCPSARGKIIYVDDDAVAPGDGSSWQTAYKFLQDALTFAEAAEKPIEVRVAQGIYKPDQSSAHPDGTGDRNASFCLLDSVAVKGGFAVAGAADPNARDIARYESILCGDLAGDDAPVVDPCDLLTEPTRAENTRYIVTAEPCDRSTILEGFTIRSGRGAALHLPENVRPCRPSIRHCTLVGNCGSAVDLSDGIEPELIDCLFLRNASWGGGAAIGAGLGRGPHPEADKFVVRGCTFAWNCARGFDKDIRGTGGAINIMSGSPSVIKDCTFVGNAAEIGGALYSRKKENIVNCRFIQNVADQAGGAIYFEGTELNMAFCTLFGNVAPAGRALTCFAPRMTVTNSILWDDGDEHSGVIQIGEITRPNVTYCDVRGGWPGEGNIDADPLFATQGYWDPNGTPGGPSDDFWIKGDYHLKSQAGRWDPISESWIKDDVTSPCIDAGDPNSPIGLEPFPNGGRINMGACGGTGEASKSYFGEPICETIIAGDINGDCRVDFRDFEIMSLHWLQGQGN